MTEQSEHPSIHGGDEKPHHVEKEPSKAKAEVFRLFGREKPVHKVLGGGKAADVLLWRDKKFSAGLVGSVTAIWALFEVFDYRLLTLVCHGLIFTLAILFLWSNASAFIHKAQPHVPVVSLPEDRAVNIALALRHEINRALALLRDIALGHELKKFLVVVIGLWILSIIGASVNFLTLFYILILVLHTLPVLYEKYEDKVDFYADKAIAEIKKQYAVVDAKVLSKIPRGPLKNKQH